MRTMDQSGFQQGWERSEVFLFDPQGDDQKDLSLHLRGLFDLGWTNVRQSQIATNVTGQAVAVGLKNFQAVFPGFEQSPSADLPLNLADTERQLPANDQSAHPNPLPWPLPQSNLEPHSSPICHGSAYAAFPTFELSSGTDLPLNAADAGQLPSNVQSFPQNFLPWPQLQSINTLSSSSIPDNAINYASFSAFRQPLTTCPAPATQSLGELCSNPRAKSGQCVRCWAQRKAVFLFIQ